MTRAGNPLFDAKNSIADQRAVDGLTAPILSFLASDPDRFARFLDITGLTVPDLRAESANTGFAQSLFDYVAADERLFVAFAEAAQQDLGQLVSLHARLSARSRGG